MGPAEDYRIYRLTRTDILKQGGVGSALAVLAAYTFYKSILLMTVLAPIGFIVFLFLSKKKLKGKRDRALLIQFKEAAWLMSGFMSAGYSAENAIAKTVPELEKLYGKNAMIKREFERMVRGIRVNIPAERLFMDLGDRSGAEDIKSFAEVFAIAKRSGGNIREIIERTTGVIRDKIAVTEEIRNMTASRRYEQSIMNMLPFAIILYINATSDGLLDVMYEGTAGRVIMTVCLMMILISYELSQKILDIRV